MRERWATKVQNECETAGFTFTKRDDNGHWECKDGGKVLFQSRSLGDVLRKVGNALEIPN
ncbi:hypothetical protein PMW_46 [Pseudomonas phage phiPMW]|uniref:Uncharacterized protein n=1 Tax=Pseudomonas phage phiPMW TaxID=1815582 RepID=A0A1S5R180_9CAUD|nr:hypothetical protein FDG97_gp046 [Pseudomonas phage phiPMW]ANA49171.1 hypothetical protein PMW_46 [Pseudomonas phage phiPMW]